MEVLLIILLIIVVYLVILFMLIKYERNKVNKLYDLLDTNLKKRWSLLPYIIDSLKNQKVERELIESLILLRNVLYKKLDKTKRFDINKELDGYINNIISLKEYSLELIEKLSILEKELDVNKNKYNKTTKLYNNLIKYFPGNIISYLFKFQKEQLY